MSEEQVFRFFEITKQKLIRESSSAKPFCLFQWKRGESQTFLALCFVDFERISSDFEILSQPALKLSYKGWVEEPTDVNS